MLKDTNSKINIAISGCVLDSECQRQVCRRKRSVFASKTTIKLSGCTARAPQWVRQVAYCLKLNAPEMALTIRSWYQDKYPVCEDQVSF